MPHTFSKPARLTLLALLVGLPTCTAQDTTIRIRFVNGKNGKSLKLKSYESGIGTGFNAGDYKIDRVDRDSLIVTFHNVSTFQFRGAAFDPCDVKKSDDAPPKYELSHIVTTGVVAPNFCGSSSAPPTPGELLIYSRHEHWWEITKRIAQGLLICG